MAIPVEVRAGDRRVFRLSREIGPLGLRLEKTTPFEPGRPVILRFVLPGDPTERQTRAKIEEIDLADGESGAAGLAFTELPPNTRDAIVRYVTSRLGLETIEPAP